MMTIRYTLNLIITTMAACVFSCTYAVDLKQAYEDAADHDPDFKATYAKWMAAKQALPIQRSLYLPQVIARVEASHGKQDFANNGPEYTDINSHDYRLSLNQKIFDWHAIEQIKKSSNAVKAAHADYASAKQQLLFEVASQYFDVLSNLADYNATLARRDALEEEYTVTQNKYNVGSVNSAQLASAKANYDYARAQLIANRNQLQISEENLSAMTGKHYEVYQALGVKLPLKKPSPQNIDTWVQQAITQNYRLQSYDYHVRMAKHNLYASYAQSAPEVELSASHRVNKLDNIDGVARGDNTDTFNESIYDYTQDTVMVSASMPLLSGGRHYYGDKQARFQYEEAQEEWASQRDTVITTTRKDYLTVINDIAYIKANHQALLSANQAYANYREAYRVGGVSYEALLDSIENVFQTQSTYFQSRYRYLRDTLALKGDVGRLGPDDLLHINQWLTTKVMLNSQGVPEKMSRSRS